MPLIDKRMEALIEEETGMTMGELASLSSDGIKKRLGKQYPFPILPHYGTSFTVVDIGDGETMLFY